MSATSADARTLAQATRSLIKGAGAKCAGRSRGPDRRVRRNSYDINDPRSRVWAPINGGDKQAGLRWRDTLLRTAREYDRVGKQPGRMGPLGPHTYHVLEAMLGLVDFATGRLEPTYETLMDATGYARSTIGKALRRLRAHGFLDWVRRSRAVSTEEGRAREQTSNAYFFDFARMPKRAWLRFRQLLERRERTATGATGSRAAASPPDRPMEAADPALRAALARLQAHIDDGAE